MDKYQAYIISQYYVIQYLECEDEVTFLNSEEFIYEFRNNGCIVLSKFAMKNIIGTEHVYIYKAWLINECVNWLGKDTFKCTKLTISDFKTGKTKVFYPSKCKKIRHKINEIIYK